METERSTTEATGYFKTLRSLWLTIAALAVTGVLIALAFTRFIAPVYQAEVSILVEVPEGTSLGAIPFISNNGPVQMMRGVVESQRMRESVANAAHVPYRTVEECLSAKGDPAESQLTITVNHPDSKLAVEMLKAAVTELRDINAQIGLNLANRQETNLYQAIRLREQQRDEINKRIIAFQNSSQTLSDPTKPSSVTQYFSIVRSLEYELGTVNKMIEARLKASEKYASSKALPLDDPRLTNLERELFQAQADFESKRRQLTKSNVELQQLQNHLRELQKQYESLVAGAIRGLQQGASVDLAALQAKQVVLQWQLRYWRERSQHAPAELVKAMDLYGELEQTTSVLEALRAKQSDAQTSQVVERFQWTQLGQPELQPEPINKDYLRNGFAGLLIGLFIGGALAIFQSDRQFVR